MGKKGKRGKKETTEELMDFDVRTVRCRRTIAKHSQDTKSDRTTEGVGSVRWLRRVK
jgi:hypothetical protein